MKIELLDVSQYNFPLPSVLTDSTHGEMKEFSVIFVKVITNKGDKGLGYTYTVGTTGASAIYSLIKNDLIPFLKGKDPRITEKIWEEMWQRLHYVGRGGIVSFAISAVDIALWDLKARMVNEPLWRFLGGYSNKVAVYAGGIDLMMTVDELRVKVKENLMNGFKAIKIKVGRKKLSEDIERVAAVREIIGPEVPLMVDANMCWTVDQAIQASRSFEKFNVFWLEEPIIPDDVTGHAKIANEGKLPIATGENLHTIYEFQKMIVDGGISYPEPDVSNIGGITAWMKVAHMAQAFNLPVTTHGIHDIHVHLLAAVPNASFLEVHGFSLEKFMKDPLEIKNGMVIAPEKPGHGIEFNWEAMKPYAYSGWTYEL